MRSRNLRNLTITVSDQVARWARIKAAEENTSVSHLVGEMLQRRMLDANAYERAMKDYLSREPFIHSGGRRPSREELHDRPGLR